MANYQIIRRLEIILHLVGGYPGISKQGLLNRLEQDYEMVITARTLERDFTALFNDLGIEVKYNRSDNGYYLLEEDQNEIQSFIQFAGRIFIGDLFRTGLKDFPKLRTAVKIQDYSNFEGLDNFPKLLQAIQDNLEVSFQHENFQKGTHTDYRVNPFQLREYKGRWYLIGWSVQDERIKTFGLDRIKHLRLNGVSEIQASDFSTELEKFNAVIGLNYSNEVGREIIRLAVSPNQYKYLKTLPIHPSQSFEKELEDERVVIQLFLIPNYELIMELMSLGDQIEVLAPEKLRKEIKSILSKNLKQYKDGKK